MATDEIQRCPVCDDTHVSVEFVQVERGRWDVTVADSGVQTQVSDLGEGETVVSVFCRCEAGHKWKVMLSSSPGALLKDIDVIDAGDEPDPSLN